MNKFDLYYFSVLADTLHYGKAAKILHITQPPLSRAIKKLEDELGVTLFKRNQRNVELTTAGEYLKRRAGSLLIEISEIRKDLKKIDEGRFGQLHITSVGSVMHIVLQEYVSKFIKRYPEVSIKMSQYTTSEQIELIKSEQADIAFLRSPVFSEGLQLHDIYRECFVLVTPKSFNKEIEKPDDLQQLDGLPYIAFPRELARGLFDQIISLCNAGDYSPNIKHETYQLDIAIRMVEAGLGITIIPESSLYGITADVNVYKLDFIEQKSVVSSFFKKNKNNPILKNFLIECLNLEF